MKTELKPYTDTENNRQNLFKFYTEVYPDSPWLLNNKRFEWQTFQNPLQKDDPAIWLLTNDENDIIGQNIYIIYNLNIDNKTYRGYCSTNLIVKPGIVGKGYGHKLIQRNEEFNGVAYAVGITPASTRAFIKRGWIYITDAKMMSRIINPVPNLRYLNWPRWKILCVYPLLKALNIVTNIRSRLVVPRNIDNIEVLRIDHFEDHWDEIWKNALSDYGIHFERQSKTLNYKYCSRPDVEHLKYVFKKDGKPVGYGVCRVSENKVKRIKLGRIVDIVYNPIDGESLLRFIISVLKNELLKYNIDGIVGVAANRTIAKAFAANGLFLSRIQPAIIKEEDFDINELKNKYNDLWYITLGDSDLDNYW